MIDDYGNIGMVGQVLMSDGLGKRRWSDAGITPTASGRPEPSRGWVSYVEALEKELEWHRAHLRMINCHRSVEPDVWYWQNDGTDHLESMVHVLPVVIQAGHLRALLDNSNKESLNA
jgi:hypothetical protein